jgi:hypothetical protein
MRIYKLSSIVGFVWSSVSLSAQSAINCPNGPGSAFGVVAYQCANCGFKQESGQRPSYTFFAEPVVTQVDYRLSAAISNQPVIVIDGVIQSSPANAATISAIGDVVEAVDGHPITTKVGADLFTYPSAGSHSLTVRRGRDRHVIDVTVPASCNTATGSATSVTTNVATGGSDVAARVSATLDGIRRGSSGGAGRGASAAGTSTGRYLGDTIYLRTDSIHRGSGAGTGSGGRASSASTSGGGGYGRGVPVIGGNAVEVTGGSGSAVASTVASPAVGKFGFAVECRPSCTMRRRPSGEYYFKYDGYPRIIEVRERSAADRAGLQVGDLITKIEGRSILADDVLHDTEQRDQLHMTIRRDGKDIEVVMVVVR